MAETVPVAGIRDWGEAMMTSATGALMLFLGAIPKIIGFVIILLVGWFIAGLIAKGWPFFSAKLTSMIWPIVRVSPGSSLIWGSGATPRGSSARPPSGLFAFWP